MDDEEVVSSWRDPLVGATDAIGDLVLVVPNAPFPSLEANEPPSEDPLFKVPAAEEVSGHVGDHVDPVDDVEVAEAKVFSALPEDSVTTVGVDERLDVATDIDSAAVNDDQAQSALFDKRRRFGCDLCAYAASRKDTLDNHVRAKHHRQRPYRCEHCTFDTTRKGTLTRHVKVVHHNSRPFRCPLCPHCAATRDKLKKHVKLRHKGKINELDSLCQRVDPLHFKESSSSLPIALPSLATQFPLPSPQPVTLEASTVPVPDPPNQEEKDSEPVTEETSTASQSSKSQIAKRTQLSHIPRPQLILSENNQLILQQPLAPEDPLREQFRCGQCGFKAANPYRLKSHIKIVHDKIKPYACDKCDYRFVTVNKLEAHKLEVHHRAKPFACEFCDFRSARPFNLHVHVSQMHLGEKPFGCGLCEFKATRRDKVRRHLFNQHGKTADEATTLINSRRLVTANDDPVALLLDSAAAADAAAQAMADASTSTEDPPIEESVVETTAVATTDVPDVPPAKPLGSTLTRRPAKVALAEPEDPPPPPPVLFTVDVMNSEEIVETSLQLDELAAAIDDAVLALDTAATLPPPPSLPELKSSTMARRYKCPRCDYSASRSNTVKVHVRAVHEQARSLQCPSCPYKSARKGDLNRHVRMVHEGKKSK